MTNKETLALITRYFKRNSILFTIIITAAVTAIALVRWSNTNIVFISTPEHVKLDIFGDLDGPDSLDLNETQFKPKVPKYLVIHITENYPNDLYYDYFDYWFHVGRGWSKMGYHEAVNPSGSVVRLTPLNLDKVLSWDEIAYHTAGYNSVSISIAIVGGLTYGMKKDHCSNTMTFMQKLQLQNRINYYRNKWPNLKIVGHRDLASKDVNKNGKIEPGEWVKPCPCFDIREWLKKNTDIDPK